MADNTDLVIINYSKELWDYMKLKYEQGQSGIMYPFEHAPNLSRIIEDFASGLSDCEDQHTRGQTSKRLQMWMKMSTSRLASEH